MRYGHGDVDIHMKTWTWRHRYLDKDMEKWIGRHGKHGDIETWRHGHGAWRHGDMDMETWT
jgi:hypothetical protein